MDPKAKRDGDERRLAGLKVGAVGLTVAGLGIFAGLAAAGTDDSPAPTVAAGTADLTDSSSASDAARAAEDDSFFDDQAQPGSVGEYEGYSDGDEYEEDDDGGDQGEWDDDDEHHGHHAPAPSAYADGGGSYAPQQSYTPSQGSTGAS